MPTRWTNCVAVVAPTPAPVRAKTLNRFWRQGAYRFNGTVSWFILALAGQPGLMAASKRHQTAHRVLLRGA